MKKGEKVQIKEVKNWDFVFSSRKYPTLIESAGSSTGVVTVFVFPNSTAAVCANHYLIMFGGYEKGLNQQAFLIPLSLQG